MTLSYATPADVQDLLQGILKQTLPNTTGLYLSLHNTSPLNAVSNAAAAATEWTGYTVSSSSARAPVVFGGTFPGAITIGSGTGSITSTNTQTLAVTATVSTLQWWGLWDSATFGGGNWLIGGLLSNLSGGASAPSTITITNGITLTVTI